MLRIVCFAVIALMAAAAGYADDVVNVEILSAKPGNAPVTKSHKYQAMVTLLIEARDGSTTPSGWSTRREAGGDGKPFAFQPGQNLIAGWTEGVLKMREGERAKIHVPPKLGYGSSDMGSKGSGWFIPANSHLLFDIEILGKAGSAGPDREL